MKYILEMLIAIVLFILIFLLTIIPKLISWAWYGKFYLNDKEDDDYFDAILHLILTITGNIGRYP